jgi:ATP-binding cassette subfamily F protein uup
LYQQWLKIKGNEESETSKPVPVTLVKEPASEVAVKPKLSFKERRELENLEKEIGELNREKEQITEKLHDASINFDSIQQLSQRFTAVTASLESKELRWLELSELV